MQLSTSKKKISLTRVPKAAKGKSKRAAGQSQDMKLREKIRTIADYMESNGIASRPELHGIRTLANNRNHVLSVDSLNAYVHNQHYNPTPTDLKVQWDSIQVFMERIWA